MKTIWSVVLLMFAGLAFGVQTLAPGQPVTANIDASKTGPPISPYIYGQFLEHAGSLIYGSL
jgi:alpha-L-arabinofuranosidase